MFCLDPCTSPLRNFGCFRGIGKEAVSAMDNLPGHSVSFPLIEN